MRSNLYERLMRRVGHTRAFGLFGRKVLTPLDSRLHGRRFTPTTFGTHLPLLYLTTTGRRTGAEHTSPLLYVRIGDNLAVAATNFGRPHDPAWAHNLLAIPTARVEVGEQTFPVTAELMTPNTAVEVWPRFVAMWPAYDTYRRRSGREVKTFRLRPA